MTPLLNLAIMNFDELSRFVQTATSGKNYVARPSEASDIDCDVCAEQIINIVLMPAIRGDHKRADSRSLRVGENDQITAELIASAALTYWQNHGFIIAQNAKLNRAISVQIKEEERAQAKEDMIALQMGTIGAVLGAKKAHKKGGLQGFWDFVESDFQIARIDSGSLEFGDATPAFVSF